MEGVGPSTGQDRRVARVLAAYTAIYPMLGDTWRRVVGEEGLGLWLETPNDGRITPRRVFVFRRHLQPGRSSI